MAVDTSFGSVHVLIQGASTANAAFPATTPGYESIPWLVAPTVSGITAGAGHLVFSSAGRLSLAQSGYPVKYWGSVLDVELVIEQAWDSFGKLLENGTIKIEADTDTPNRYELHWNAFYLHPNATPHWEVKGGFFAPSNGKFLLRVHGTAATNTVSVTVITEANASTTAVFSVGGFMAAYPLTIGTPGTASQVNPLPSEASAAAAGDPAGQFAYATPSRATFFTTFNRSTTPTSGTVTISGCGASYVANAAGKTASALSAELASGFTSALTSVGYAASYSFNGTSYEIAIQPKSASDPHYPYHSFSVSGSAMFAAAGEGWAENATVPPSTGVSLQRVAVWGAPPGVVQTSRFTVFVADGAKDYLLSMTVAGVTATANLQNNVVGALATLAGQLGLGAWQQTTPGTYINSRSYTNPGPVPDTAAIVQNVVQSSAITKMYALRVTAAERTEATFPTLPWPTTSIPSSGGGGGGTTLPANVLLAANFEGGIGADLSQYAAAYSSGSRTSLSIQSTGSRTGDGYISNTDGSLGNNVYAVFTPSAAGRAAWQSATELTVEFDLLVTAVPLSGAQIFGLDAQSNARVFTFGLNGIDAVTCQLDAYIFGLGSAVQITKNVWHHIAVSYGPDGQGNGVTALYVDGVWVNGSVTGPYTFDTNHFSAVTLFQSSSAVAGGNGSLQGGFDNLLITSARKYTANFTPPGAIVGTAPPLSASSLYLKFEDGAASATLANSGSVGGPFPVVSGSVTTTQSRDGTGSFLTDGIVGLSTGFSVPGPGTGDYTAEMWVMFPSLGAGSSMFAGDFNSGGFYVGNNGQIGWIGSGTSNGMGDVVPNVWYHIAAVRAGGKVRFFLNGIASPGSVSSVGASGGHNIASPFLLGENGSYGASVVAHIDEYRFTNAALYTANFTPQAPLQDLTPPPTASDVRLAGYNTLDGVTGTGTFNTQATYPTAYFSANATLDDALSSGGSFAVDGNTINFTSSHTLAAATSTGTFVQGTPVTFDGSATAEDATGNSSFYAGLPMEWSGDSVLEDASQLALYLFLAPAEFSGDAVLDGVTPGLTSFSLIDPVVWRVDATVPMATLVANATQFLVNAQVPAVTLRASMSEYRGFELDAQVPAASLSAWAGLGLLGQVPMATLSASGTVVNTLRLDADLPRVTMAADASLGRLLSMSATVPAPTLSAWAGAGLRGAVPAATGAANVISGGAFRVDATVPAAAATIGATSMNVLRLVGDVPAVARANWLAISRQVPAIGMLAHIAPVSAVTRVAYSFTLANSAMTRYPAYPFIQVIRMGNAFYGVAEDGLHEIGGTTDNAAPIPWTWETCLSDFGQAERKTVVSAYLGGYVPEAMTYTIRAGDVPTGTNAHATTATAVLRNHRQKFGIGRKSRYFAFGLSAAQGRVAIESIEFEVAPMSRRI